MTLLTLVLQLCVRVALAQCKPELVPFPDFRAARVRVACDLPAGLDLSSLNPHIYREPLEMADGNYLLFISDRERDVPLWRVELHATSGQEVIEVQHVRAYDEERDKYEWSAFVRDAVVRFSHLNFQITPAITRKLFNVGFTTRDVYKAVLMPVNFVPLRIGDDVRSLGRTDGPDFISVTHRPLSADRTRISSIAVIHENLVRSLVEEGSTKVRQHAYTIIDGPFAGRRFEFARDVARRMHANGIDLRDIQETFAAIGGLAPVQAGAQKIAGKIPTHWALAQWRAGRIVKFTLTQRPNGIFLLLNGSLSDGHMQRVFNRLPKLRDL